MFMEEIVSLIIVFISIVLLVFALIMVYRARNTLITSRQVLDDNQRFWNEQLSQLSKLEEEMVLSKKEEIK